MAKRMSTEASGIAWYARLRVVFKHNLLADRPDRMLAHEAARAAGEQGQFRAMHDLLLANQPPADPTAPTRSAAHVRR